MLDVATKKTIPEPEPEPVRRQVNARLPGNVALALHNYIENQPVPPTATAVAIVALKEFLERAGYYPPPADA